MPSTGGPTSTGQASPCAGRAFSLLAVSPETWVVDIGRSAVQETSESLGSTTARHAIWMLAPPGHNASATALCSMGEEGLREPGTYHLV